MDPFSPIIQNNKQHRHHRASTLIKQGQVPLDKKSIVQRRLSQTYALQPQPCPHSSALGKQWKHVGTGSGSLTRAGTHYRLQSSQRMYCVLNTAQRQQPRQPLEPPNYDLEVDLKFGKPGTSITFIFGYRQDGTGFYACTGNIKTRTWVLKQYRLDQENRKMSPAGTILSKQMEKNIKPHLFCKVYLQVRGGKEISLDINDKPICTSTVLHDGCVGNVGVAALHHSSMTFKNFRITTATTAATAATAAAAAASAANPPPLPPAPTSSTTPHASLSLPPPAPNLGDPQLVEQIERDMIHASDNTNAATVVQYNQIAGHTEAKRLLQEAIVMPMLVPELFNGIRQPWKGVLLFGKSWHMGHLLVVVVRAVVRMVVVVSLLLLLLLLLCRD
jgi:hypothetical protein